MNIDAIQLLLEAKQALINRDAVKCYDSGEHPCNCTLCKIDRFVEQNNIIIHTACKSGNYFKDLMNSGQGYVLYNGKWYDGSLNEVSNPLNK